MAAKRHNTTHLPSVGSWFKDLNVSEPRALTAISVGAAVFELEQMVQTGNLPDARAEIAIFGRNSCGYELEGLRRAVNEVLLFVLKRRFGVRFANTPFQVPLEGVQPSSPNPYQVCLFSGGVDSFSGLLLAGERGETEAVFCAHRDQSRLIGIVHRIQGRLSARGLRTE
jgi:hypothetical protein